ncbi:hypothetical protein JX265_008608 [Neoarthrinium moseri]|uniref:DUF7905 domain-containing protein n=1 Tax=Neoarthrinium moseri TaxID=1658444 RepID=A0A9P9WHW3_9PEZI|nr:hypothetical protein JX265_008608 [Neoarthrinium moseri]
MADQEDDLINFERPVLQAQVAGQPGEDSLTDTGSVPAAADNRRDLAAQTVSQDPRQPVRLPMQQLSDHWAAHRKSTQLGPIQRPGPAGHAYFFVSHAAELSAGVIEAVHGEMLEFAKDRSDVFFDIQGRGPTRYLAIRAPSVDLAHECLDEARTCADNIIFDKTVRLDAAFVKPPPYPLDSVEIKLARLPASGSARPTMLPCSQPRISLERAAAQQESSYGGPLRQQLASALSKAGRIKERVNLRVRLGHFHLLAYPRQEGRSEPEFTYGVFSDLVKKSRTKSQVMTQVGGLGEAMQILKAIKTNTDSFLAEDMAVLSVADVGPVFVFEALSKKHKFEAQLRPLGNAGLDGGAGNFKVSNIDALELMEGSIGKQLDFRTLCLDQPLDWKIETVNEQRKTIGFEALKSEIRGANIRFTTGEGDKDEHYPRLYFANKDKVFTALDKVAMQSLFRFRYNPAPYAVEFVLRRQWDSPSAMVNMEVDPVTTFGITIYGEDWSDTRASEITRTGQGWGTELEHLFRQDHGGQEDYVARSGQERVQAFLDVLDDIQHALSPDTRKLGQPSVGPQPSQLV